MNIEIIESFLNQIENNILLINQINEETDIFYILLIEYLAKKRNIKINKYDQAKENIEVDLFGNNQIRLVYIKKISELDAFKTSNYKTIIFLSYQNYKKQNKNFKSINAYNIKQDTKELVKNYFKIDNNKFILSILDSPHMVFEEAAKYFINDNYQYFNINDLNEKNTLLEIRKSIFSTKLNLNIKELYELNKKEILFKKLNFLTS